MKTYLYEQYSTVREDTAEQFTAKLNSEIYRLRSHNPRVVISESDPLCAYIKYSISEEVPESVQEKTEMEGITFKCKHCPYFKPILKEDETEDKRCKYGDCEFAELGRTKKEAPACEMLYTNLKECMDAFKIIEADEEDE